MLFPSILLLIPVAQEPLGSYHLDLPEGLPERFSVQVEIKGRRHRLDLARFSLRSPDFQVRVVHGDGSHEQAAPPPVRTYRGHLRNRPEVQVAGSLREDGLHAVIHFPGGEDPLRLVPLSRQVANAPPGWHQLETFPPLDLDACGVAGKGPTLPSSQSTRGPSGTQVPPPSSWLFPSPPGFGPWRVREAQIAYDADYCYFQREGNSVAGAVAGVENQLAQLELCYGRDAMTVYELTAVVVRDQPYYNFTGAGNALSTFAGEWDANHWDIPRDTAYLLTDYQGDGIAGIAYVGTLGGWSYAATTWDRGYGPGIMAHEVGHNWGYGHGDCWPWGGSAMCGAWLLLGPETSDVVQWRGEWLGLPVVAPYTIPAPPYCDPDRPSSVKDREVILDVLANDHDVNHDPILIVGHDATTSEGGAVTLIPGNGQGQRDRLLYTPDPEKTGGYVDTFWYTGGDPGGLTGNTIVEVSVSREDLVLSWKMDEISGSLALDSSGRESHGVIGLESVLVEIPDPVVTSHANAAAGTSASGLLDADPDTGFTSAWQGPVSWSFSSDPSHGTWMEFEFPQDVEIAGMRHLDRANWWEWTAASRLIFSLDSTFDSSDPFVDITHWGHGSEIDYPFLPTQARWVRWEVTGAYDSGNPFAALGGNELSFLGQAVLSRIDPPALTANSNPVSGYPFSNLFDSNASSQCISPNGEVTIPFTTNPGHGTWFEGDFGAIVDIQGWMHQDRPVFNDWTGRSRLIFSGDSVFDASDSIVEIQHSGHGSPTFYSFPSVSARFVRWEITGRYRPSASHRLGGVEMAFFTGPSGLPGHGWVNSPHGNALEVAGWSEVSVENASGIPTAAADSWTLNLHVMGSQTPPDRTWIGGFGDPQATGNGLRYFVVRNGNLAFSLGDQELVSSTPWNPGIWQVLTATFHQGRLKLWRDGVKIAQGDFSLGSASSDVRLSPLATRNGTSRFVGQLDEFTLWNWGMTGAEVSILASGGRATVPSPADGARSVEQTATLAWIPGLTFYFHDVYFGTDFTAVRDADITSTEYQGVRLQPTFNPGPLAPLTTYYWRIDEITVGGEELKGAVWRFTTAMDWSVDPLEAFTDGADGQELNGLAGGSGFSGPWNAPIGHGFLHRNGSIGAYPGNVPFVESGGFFEGPQRRWDGTSCSRPLDTSAIDFDLGGDDTYFLSFAIRRAPGVYDPVGLVGLRDGPSGPGISIGFRNGNWQLEGDLGSASGGTATASKTWFVVARVTATSQSTDQIHMKIYDTAQDLVHASETLLNGQGPGTDQWTLISSGGTSSSVLSHLRLDTHSGTIGSTTVPIQVDEIRLGRSWADITGL